MNVRAAVSAMNAYAWEESSRSLALRFGLPKSQVIRFDMNTLACPLPVVAEKLNELNSLSISEYPSADYGDLLEALARYQNISTRQLVVGAGADEVIDVIAKAFVENGNKAVISAPTYSMFGITCASYGADVVLVPRAPDYALDVEALIERAKNAQLVFVCNPNSPTGNAEPVSKVRTLVESTPATVVVDEAYAEFGGESATDLVEEYENLVVVRTMSKAFGLAGMRVGYAVTNENLASELNKLRLPNSVSAFSAILAEAALSKEGIRQMRQGVAKTLAERMRMARFLSRRFRPFKSETNFLLVDFLDTDAGALFQTLLKKGLVVRNFSQKALTKNCLRITVRNVADNNRLLEALE